MTHRDRAGDPPGRREAAGDAGHRQGFPTPPCESPTAGSPARPERRFPKAFGLRRARLPMSRIATPRAPGRKPWEAVSMGHYQRSLVYEHGRSIPLADARRFTRFRRWREEKGIAVPPMDGQGPRVASPDRVFRYHRGLLILSV